MVSPRVPRLFQLLAVAAGASILAACAHGLRGADAAPLYHGPVSDHFDGLRFFNPEGEQGAAGGGGKGPHEFLAMVGAHRNWPKSVPIQRSVPEERVAGDRLRVTWIGHATVLIQTQGLNVLVDPIWAHFDSPVQAVVRPRVRAPGVRIEDLPPIDLVLISHTHLDHLDMGALKFVHDRDRPMIVGGLGFDALMRGEGMKGLAGDWGDRIAVRPGIDLVLNRAHHWSGRWLNDRDLVLWTGFTLVLPGGNVYYAGDTGPGDMAWVDEAKMVGPIRLAILPIGPTHVDTPQSRYHINARDAVTAFERLGAPNTLGVHWGTFEMTDGPVDGSPTMVRSEVAARNLPADRFRTLEAGASWDVAQTAD